LYSSLVALLLGWDARPTILPASTASQTSQVNGDHLGHAGGAFVPGTRSSCACGSKDRVRRDLHWGTNSSSTLTAVVDDQASIGITRWTESGTHVFPLIATLLEVTSAKLVQGQVSVRWYPLGLKSNDGTKVGRRAV
jgi:hypothetical protein